MMAINEIERMNATTGEASTDDVNTLGNDKHTVLFPS